jgi:hypothetical protein
MDRAASRVRLAAIAAIVGDSLAVRGCCCDTLSRSLIYRRRLERSQLSIIRELSSF